MAGKWEKVLFIGVDTRNALDQLKNFAKESESTLQGIKLKTLYSAEGKAAGAELEASFKSISKEVKNASEGFDDFEKALRRAFIVAPVWMVTRAAVKEFIDFFKEGIQYFYETERATTNLTSVLQQMGTVGTASVESMLTKLKELSLATGVGIGKMSETFVAAQRILQDTEGAYKATAAAANLAKFANIEEAKAAELLSFMYLQQRDSLKSTSQELKNFHDLEVMLYRVNSQMPGGIQAFISSYRNLLPTLKEMNISLDDAIKLIIAYGQTGLTSSQSIRTGLMKVFTNMTEIAPRLGITISESSKPFDIFIESVNRISEIMRSGNLSTAGRVIQDLFGGIRGGQAAVLATANEIDKFRNILSKPLVSPADYIKFNELMENITKEANYQIKIFDINKKTLGEMFVTGLVGGENFGESLRKVNEFMYSLQFASKTIGTTLGLAFRYFSVPGQIFSWIEPYNRIAKTNKEIADLGERLTLAMRGQLSLADTIAVKAEFQNSRLARQVLSAQNVNNALDKQIQLKIQAGEIQEENNKKLEAEKKKQEEINYLTKQQYKEIEQLIFNYDKMQEDSQDYYDFTADAAEQLRLQIEFLSSSVDKQLKIFEEASRAERELYRPFIRNLPEEAQTRLTELIAKERGIELPWKREEISVSPLRGATFITPIDHVIDTMDIIIKWGGTPEEMTLQLIEAIGKKMMEDPTIRELWANKLRELM